MKLAHAGMGITEAEFTAAVNDLAATLDKFNFPAEEKSELLTVVVSTKSEIVGQ
jgi:hemoglobin